MPNLDGIPIPLYTPLDPYNSIVDSIPISAIIQQIQVVNNAVDNNTAILDQSIGTQGTLANRLAQSINPDGTLITVAIDNALHNISQHLDDGGFVRMQLTERSKLSFIAPNATSLSINVETISGTIPFSNAVMNIGASDSITWGYDGTTITANTDFPASVRHTHYYGYNGITTDGQNYTVSTVNTPYQSGSLRVTINGVRLNENVPTYVPFGQPGAVTWIPLYYTEGAATSNIVAGGNFQLSVAVALGTNLIVDWDQLYI